MTVIWLVYYDFFFLGINRVMLETLNQITIAHKMVDVR